MSDRIVFIIVSFLMASVLLSLIYFLVQERVGDERRALRAESVLGYRFLLNGVEHVSVNRTYSGNIVCRSAADGLDVILGVAAVERLVRKGEK